VKALLIAGGAFGVAALLSSSSLGKTAGKANRAAAAALAGHGFVVPSSASMVETYEAMAEALSSAQYPQIEQTAKLWLAAAREGAKADPLAYPAISDWLCETFDNELSSKAVLANAYCALRSRGAASISLGWEVLAGGGGAAVDAYRKDVYALIRELAAAMDARDYLTAAQRKNVDAARAKASDDSVAGALFGGVLGDFDPSKLFGLSGVLPDLGGSIKSALSDAIVPVIVIGAAGIALYLAVRK
jgi:hypothetical protein